MPMTTAQCLKLSLDYIANSNLKSNSISNELTIAGNTHMPVVAQLEV